MNITTVSPLDVFPYDKNAKKHPPEQIELIANSIREFGFMTPIVVDKEMCIVQGHGRVLASIELGLTEIPAVIADTLDESQIKMLRLADNRVAESDWDKELLEKELETLLEFFTIEDFGFELNDPSEPEQIYTDKIEIPIYEPKGIKPEVSQLVDTSKREDLIKKINKAKIPKDLKEFLKSAAYRHDVFDFAMIAEYYSHLDTDIKDLFEQSALVIIDYEKAIENGYVEL